MSPESRAKYFKDRRGKFKYFSAEVERSKIERFESYLKSVDKTRAEWLNEKIDEALGKKG